MTAYDLSRYLNVRSAYGSSFAPDGTLAFLMNTTGVAQAWSLTEPQGWPEQLTFYDDTVSFVDYSPERQELVFGMDEGGNERAQLYRLDADGRVHELTGMPDAKHRWGGWSPDGERFAFASNRRDEAVFDIYVQDRDATGDNAELVWEGDGWLSVGGFSPDGERLLVSEAHSSFDQDIYVLDIDSGDLSHLTPHEGKVRYTSASWGPDGDAVYLVTDAESDTLELARLSLEGDLDIVRSDDQWNIDGVALDKDSGRLVYSRNVDGYNELTVGELTGPTTIETFPTPDLPGGLAGGVAWGPMPSVSPLASPDGRSTPTCSSSRPKPARANSGRPLRRPASRARRSSSQRSSGSTPSTGERFQRCSPCRTVRTGPVLTATRPSSSTSTAARRASVALRSPV